MPMPGWVARVNKRFFNPIEIRRGARPVLTHVGRKSGRTYRTPLDAHPVGDGWIFVVVYGPGSDWVRNVIHAGRATLEIDGERIELANPRLVSGSEARKLLPAGVKMPPSFLRIDDFLHLDRAS